MDIPSPVHGLRIGVSGWNYPSWRGDFYPVGLAQRSELAFISRELNSIELNGTFYSLRKPSDYQRWAAAVPDGFVFYLASYGTVWRSVVHPF